MNQLFRQALDALVSVTTRSPFAVPIWAALVWLVVLIVRRPVLKAICRMLGVADLSVIKAVSNRIDLSLQGLLIIAAIWPFAAMAPGAVGRSMKVLCSFLAPFLAIHIAIQCGDLALFGWFLKQRKHLDVPSIFRFVLLGALYAVAFFLLLDWVMQIDVVPLLATSTVVTAVLGFALQDTLKNLFAGLTISLERSFRQGDWVLFRPNSARPLEGEIIEIGWRSTKMRTINNHYVVIPNSEFTSQEVINYRSPTTVHACELTFPIPVRVDPEKIKSALEESGKEADGVLGQPSPQAMPIEVKLDQIVYMLRLWINRPEERDIICGQVIAAAWQRLSQLDALPDSRTCAAPGDEGTAQAQ